jgi:hypothetical protein
MARRTVTTRTERESKVTSRITNDPDAPVVEKPGLGYADAIVFVTTILLLAAFVMTDYMIGKQFGKGIFFSK